MKAWSAGTVLTILRRSHSPLDSDGFLTSIRYMSCTIRPSALILPLTAKKSLISMDFNLAMTASGSSVPAALMALR